MFELIDYILLAIIEGFSEFLPVSSTGHMILYDELLSLTETSDARQTYMIVIQAGAIMAVIHLYFRELWESLCQLLRQPFARQKGESADVDRFLLPKLAISVLPFGLLGYLFKEEIKVLFSADLVAVALIFGGLLLILDHVALKAGRVGKLKQSEFKWPHALGIGVCQCAALWPGFSRSAASILGARLLGFQPEHAAKLSFLIGLPTLVGTAGYEALSEIETISGQMVLWMLMGSILSWLTAFLSVKWFLKIVGRGGMLGFGIYRIVLGASILLLL